MTTRRRHADPTDLPHLRLLDPTAPGRDRAGSPAAQQLLTRIVQTPRSLGKDTASHDATISIGQPVRARVARQGQASRRPWVLAGAAVAVTGVVVALPTLPGGSGTAFASWTPVPTAVAPAEAAELQADCLSHGPHADGTVKGALTERRGGFTFTLVATDEAVGNCMVLDSALTRADTRQEVGASSWGQISDLPEPPVGGTSVLWGATFRSAAGEFTSAVGRTGADVVAVEIAAGDQPEIHARVGQGYFTAWWPGSPDDELTVTTTLVNGTRTTRTLQSGDR